MVAEKESTKEKVNVPSGTVVDNTIVINDQNRKQGFDFYLTAPKTSFGTANPIHCHVIKNTIGLGKKQIEAFTYEQCHNYVNYPGPIKVPASVMYAHKLPYYVYKIKELPPDSLSNNLHFI